jgi:hypothetical protein
MRSLLIATVLDLRRKIQTVIGERRRTNANETEIETTRAAQPAEPTPADRCLGTVASPIRSRGTPAGSATGLTPMIIGMSRDLRLQ